MTLTLRDLLADGKVHVLDGAMGTMLYSKGFFLNVCYDELSVKQPKLVQEVHEAYVRAGAEILETNTFGANPVKLRSYGLADDTEQINRAAAELARKASAGRASVVGAIGPLGVRLEPFGALAREEAFAHFQRQAQGLIAGGVDGFILETFSDVDEIHQALRAVQSISRLPVIAQMTIGDDGLTHYGTAPETFAKQLAEWGADVIGVNCSVGPAGVLEAVEKLVKATDRPISAVPNAGLPKDVGDRKIYLASPEHMASYARRMVEAGARFVGGCCGTTPEHIKKIRDYVSSVAPRRPSAVVSRERVQPAPGVQPVPLAERSRWGAKLAQGKIVPPKGVDPAPMLAQCRALKAADVDAVNVPDGPRAQSRMGVLPSALLIEREVGIETVIHYCCRDRNLLGMLSDILGAAAGGLRNILVITGDPPKMGPYPDSTAVFDIDSIGLTNLVYRLNHGLDPGNNPIGGATRWVIGVGVNPAAVDVDRELSRFHWKVDAGAEFAVTQPVFDPRQLESFLERVASYRIPVVAGIWPLLSLRNAEFMANEVPGVIVPDHIIDRMRRASAKSKEHGVQEGIAIAREMLERVRPSVQGVQVSAPFGKVELALEVFKETLTPAHA